MFLSPTPIGSLTFQIFHHHNFVIMYISIMHRHNCVCVCDMFGIQTIISCFIFLSFTPISSLIFRGFHHHNFVIFLSCTAKISRYFRISRFPDVSGIPHHNFLIFLVMCFLHRHQLLLHIADMSNTSQQASDVPCQGLKVLKI